MDLGELGGRIKLRRETRGLKQADLANALRVSPQAVSKWERGENAPDISVLVPLARLLDVAVEWLLGGSPAERETFEAVVFLTTLRGFAERARKTGPQAIAAWINGHHYTVTEAVRHFDGVPVKYVGDGFLAFFSGTQMTERAARAALRARELVKDDNFAVVLHRGPIYLGKIGHPDYASPDILGATVNTAFLALPEVSAHFSGRAVFVGALEVLPAELGARPLAKKVETIELFELIEQH